MSSSSSSLSGSSLFSPYRGIGFVSSSVPAHLKSLGTERFLTVAVGRTWQVYNLDRIRVVLMSSSRSGGAGGKGFGRNIQAIASLRDLTFTAVDNNILVWRRQTHLYTVKGVNPHVKVDEDEDDEEGVAHVGHSAPIYTLYMFGSLLISIDEAGLLCIWDTQDFKNVTSVQATIKNIQQIKQETESKEPSVKQEEGVKPTPSKGPAEVVIRPISVLDFRKRIHASLSNSLSFSSLSSSSSTTAPRITSILHPSTYLNKVLIGWEDGSLELWNIHTKTLIYKFDTSCWFEKYHPQNKLQQALGINADEGKDKSQLMQDKLNKAVLSITSLEQSSAIDVVGVGLSNGQYILLHLKQDVVVSSFHQAFGLVTSSSFRSDGFAHVATAGPDGSVAVWDLEKKALLTLLPNAHNDRISSMYFLPNEPILLTVGFDNAIKMWIFDQADGSGRLLRSRCGHSAPPTRVRFYPQERGLGVLTSAAGTNDRSLRYFSLTREELSMEFSQNVISGKSKSGAGNGVAATRASVVHPSLLAAEVSGLIGSNGTQGAKLTAIKDISVSSVREKEWSNILTYHDKESAAYSWKFSSKTLDSRKLFNPHAPAAAVKSTCISACGNYAIVGCADGRIDMFNLQSGQYRHSFGTQFTKLAQKHINRPKGRDQGILELKKQVWAEMEEENEEMTGHDGAVTGLAIDGLNDQLISVSLDGSVRFWDFKTKKLKAMISCLEENQDVPTGIQRMAYSRASELAACITDAGSLVVIDTQAHTLVRRFTHLHQHGAGVVTDLAFSPDSRWLLVSSTDCTIRVFDLPTARLVDWFAFSSPVTSLAFSPRGDFLATTHVNNIGVFLWANRQYFHTPAFVLASEMSAAAVAEARLDPLAWLGRKALNKPIEMELPTDQHDADEEENIGGIDTSDVAAEQDDDDESEDDESDTSSDEDEVEGDDNQGKSKRRRKRGGLRLTDDEYFSLIVYSSLPKSKWQTLSSLELIKERNKPKVAPKAPENVPFFLANILTGSKSAAPPAASSGDNRPSLADDLGVSAFEQEQKSTSHVIRSGASTLDNPLIVQIQAAKERLRVIMSSQTDSTLSPTMLRKYLSEAYDPVTNWLQSLSPSAIDAEIRALGLDPTTEEMELQTCLEYFLAALETMHSFEWVQSVLHLFLDAHASTLQNYPKLLKGPLKSVRDTQKRVWNILQNQLHQNIALVSHLADIQM